MANGFTSVIIPSSTVAFFNGTAAPAGWTEQTSARGMYIVALVSGGTLGATVGTALSDKENRPAGQHTHPVSDPGHTHDVLGNGSNVGTGAPTAAAGWGSVVQGAAAQSHTTGVTTSNPTGSVAGTPAPYVQYLCVQKS